MGFVLPEKLGRFREDLDLKFELTNSFPGTSQLCTLERGDAKQLASIDLILTDPIMKARLADAQFSGSGGDRFTSTNESNSACSEFDGERSWHASQPSSKAQNSAALEVTNPWGRSNRGAESTLAALSTHQQARRLGQA